jgi:hypothetical protein
MYTKLIDVAFPVYTPEETERLLVSADQHKEQNELCKKCTPIVLSILKGVRGGEKIVADEFPEKTFLDGRVDGFLLPLFKEKLGITLELRYVHSGGGWGGSIRRGYEIVAFPPLPRADLQEFQKTGAFSDFKIHFDGAESCPVHRVILARFSPVLEALFLNDMKEKQQGECHFTDSKLKESGTNVTSVKRAIDVCYGAKIGLKSLAIKDIGNLYGAARFLQITPLTTLCASELQNRLTAMDAEKLDLQVITEISEIAEFHDIASLQALCQLLLPHCLSLS